MVNKIKSKIQIRINQHFRKQRHASYLLSRIVDLRNQICRQACMYGTVDELTRILYLKYNTRLHELQNKNK